MQLSARGIFLFFTCLYVLSIGRGFYSSDGDVMFQTTATLAERGTFILDSNPSLPQIIRGRSGDFYSKYDPGLPLVALPFYVVADRIAHINAAHRYRLAATFYLLVPSLSAAGALVALALLGQLIWPERSTAITYSVLAAGLATPLWPYARMLFAEATLACVLTVTVLAISYANSFVTSSSPHHVSGYTGDWLLLAGLVFGLGLMIRASLAIYTPALIFLIIFRPHQKIPHFRTTIFRLGMVAVGVLPGVLILAWHNLVRFGDPFQFGYAGEAFTTSPWEGALGLLFSPGKGVLFYAPPLFLSALLWSRFRREQPALAGFLALAWGGALMFFGAWWAWHGGWCWGPRFLVPLMPLSCLPLIVLPDVRLWRRASRTMIIFGVSVQLLGVLTDVIPHYATLVKEDSTDYMAFQAMPQHMPLVSAMRRIFQGQIEPLGMFRLSETGLPPTWTVGVPTLLVAGVIIGAAMLVRSRAQP